MSAMGSLSEFQLSAAERLELPGSIQNGAAAQLMAGRGPVADLQVLADNRLKPHVSFQVNSGACSWPLLGGKRTGGFR